MKQIERRIVVLEEHEANAVQVGTLAQWLAWNSGEDVPEAARRIFEERRAVARAQVEATMADFDDD